VSSGKPLKKYPFLNYMYFSFKKFVGVVSFQKRRGLRPVLLKVRRPQEHFIMEEEGEEEDQFIKKVRYSTVT
jgi:hypothetical protein